MLPWKRTMSRSIPLLLCLLFITLSTVHALFGVSSSRGGQSTTGSQVDPASPQGVAQEAFDRASSHSTVKHSAPHTNSYGQSDPSSENSASPPTSQVNRARELLSSNSVRRIRNDATETAQDVWNLLHPSIDPNKLTEERTNDQSKQTQSDVVSLDDATKQLRAIIHILCRTHNALLEKKLTDLPVLQRVWFKLFYSCGDPLVTRYEAKREQKALSTLSSLINAARDFASISGNSNLVRENINAVTTTFAREILLALTALKDAVQNAAHGGWLVAFQVKAYVDELTQKFSANSEKWIRRVTDLSEAAKPATGNVASKEYVQDLLRDMEKLLSEFKDEMWRMHTEWVYKRSETVSWANENLFTVKQLGKHEFERVSSCARTHGRRITRALKEGLEASRAKVAYFQQSAAERVSDLIGLLEISIDIAKGMFTTVERMFKYYNGMAWRVLAFVAFVVLVRFLLSSVRTDPGVRHYIADAFSRTRMSGSLLRGIVSTQIKRSATPHSGSPAGSEMSESNPTLMEHSSEHEEAPDVPNPSHVSETASYNNDTAFASAVQRQKRRTSSRTAKTAGETRSFQTLNLDYQTAPCNLPAQTDGQPIRIGDHEVKLVYKDAPSDSLTDDSRNNLGEKQRRTATKNRQRISHRDSEKLVPERTTKDSGDEEACETSSSFETANSEPTRASIRRISRRSHIR